jgi:quercetin dioxygenase-like cupin family protein
MLIKLGKALDMKLGTLIASGEDRPYTVVRVSERQAMSRYASQRGNAYGYTYEALAPHKKNRSMEPFLVTLREAAEDVPPATHDGEEFIHVLEGQMEAIVGEAREILSPGDSIYYDSTVPHLLRPHGEVPTVILAVIFASGR